MYHGVNLQTFQRNSRKLSKETIKMKENSSHPTANVNAFENHASLSYSVYSIYRIYTCMELDSYNGRLCGTLQAEFKIWRGSGEIMSIAPKYEISL